MFIKRTAIIALSIILLGQGCAKPVVTPAPGPVTQTDTYHYASEPPASNGATTPMTQPNRSNLSFPGVLPATETANKLVRIKTAKGDIVFELLPAEGPNAASNFVYLVQNHYYDGLNFHRREEGFVIQGGDPNGNGTGGPGYKFADDPVKFSYSRGIVAMANAGPNTNGSQFFVMLDDVGLPPLYSVFGRVISGMEVVDKIMVGDVMTSVTLEDKK